MESGERSLAIRSTIRSFRAIALQLLFPIECIGCGREGVDACSECMRRIHALRRDPYCFHCRRPWAAEDACAPCARVKGIPKRLWALGNYSAPLLQECIRALKYGGRTSLAHSFGGLLAHRLCDDAIVLDSLGKDPPIVIPVPLSRRRRVERGFNQAELIARELSLESRWPLQTDLIRRYRHTASQTDLSHDQRSANTAGAFVLTRESARTPTPKRVLIIDDVWTTGSTMKEVGRVLQEWGVEELYGAVVAVG